MRIITSLAPKSIERQQECVDSWRALNIEVVSINGETEIDKVGSLFTGVDFVLAERTADKIHNLKIPYPSLRSVLKYIFEQKDPTWIVNSDIFIDTQPEVLCTIEARSTEGLVFGSRVDIKEPHDREGKLYIHGFDYFVIHPKFQHIFTSTVDMCFGQPWWDYWVPLTFIRKQCKIILSIAPIALHLLHEQNWDGDALYYYGYEAAKEMGYKIDSKQDIANLTWATLNTIYNEAEEWNVMRSMSLQQ